VQHWSADTTRQMWELGVALACGLMVGAEREQRNADESHYRSAGIRTFAIASLTGGMAALVGTPVAIAGTLAVAGYGVAAYFRSTMPSAVAAAGMTTELALLLTYLLGVASITMPALALGAAVVTSLLLSMRVPMHNLLRRGLSERDLREALMLAVSALVILPLVPDRQVGPFEATNFYTLWRLAVVMMALTAVGHIAERTLGRRIGPTIAGLASGFVSSSATIAAMGTRSKHGDAASPIAAACASSVATFIQVAVLIGLAAPSLLQQMAVPLAIGGTVIAAYTGVRALAAAKAPTPATTPAKPKQAFDIPAIAIFTLLVGVVGIVAAWIKAQLGANAVIATSAVAGLLDAHATSASAASMYAAQHASSTTAMLSILAALSANSLTKVVVAFATGTRRFAWQVASGVILALATTWAALWALAL